MQDVTPEALARWLGTLSDLRSRAEDVAEADLSSRQAITRGMLLAEMDSHSLAGGLGMERWTVDQLVGPQVDLLDLPRVHAVTDEGEQNFVKR